MADFTELLTGYQRFRREGWSGQRARWSELSEGQSPQVMVIACSDSRVDPAQIFDIGGGRHGVSAALEFAVTQLEVGEVVVMGHGSCGGVAAAMTQRFAGCAPGAGGFIDHWVDMLDAARERIIAEHGTGPDAVRELELETVRVSATCAPFPVSPNARRQAR